MCEPELVEDFFGVYLLCSINPKYKGRTYIGYTRNPNRRITQHNRGTWAGGAHKTSNRGPWKMVMIIHGFPNNISALRFEWAWQNPTTTTRLQHLNLKKIPRKETEFQFKIRILLEMLRIGPWCRLPLTIRWLENDYITDFPAEKQPPDHMHTRQGLVKSRNLKNNQQLVTILSDTECLLCSKNIIESNTKLECLNNECELVCHLICLSELFLEPGQYVPIEGVCPFCDMTLKWGDLIRKMKGCSQNAPEPSSQDDVECLSDDEAPACSQDRGFVDNNSRWFDECVNDDL